MSASGMGQTDWTGTWHGATEAYPEGQLGHGWNVTFIIGPYPMTDETCTIWNNLYVDEGSGATAAVQWINDILVSSFKFNGVFAVATMRIRGDTLEEEIIIADDKPAAENILVSMRAQSINLKKMKRITT
ncbi:unnamed protein product [Didymodactylos carnosus]|uniref:Uncharacterized protein n=1 Tax=Didymodactylos carnosus TaxID=1234261 RepID=A0A815EZS3_9BILA|nr:unnamed protein product [Didymodactylos carnosus]CAF4159155.1 unnamed protein product [Didymodactylos carnosus]